MSESMKGHEFRAQLRLGQYTSLGSYPRFLVLTDGACFCFKCATKERARISRSATTKDRDGWRPAGFDINWETPDFYCDNCSQRIESAYAEDES